MGLLSGRSDGGKVNGREEVKKKEGELFLIERVILRRCFASVTIQCWKVLSIGVAEDVVFVLILFFVVCVRIGGWAI